MRYSKRISNYLERIALSRPTHLMGMIDPITIIKLEKELIDSEYYLEKEFTELIYMNP